MGLSPGDVRKLSLWQLKAAIDGWNKAHGGKEGAELSDKEALQIGEMLDAPPVWAS
ncbi:hypothetical protein OICFNHDK_3790 [Methylobacterium bullatum]|uniref:Uncharacterized protein n=1 Tax=Methylobacterium bullatum TaxID=570505 RepID=A0AAV4ZBX8_9HYPH|nr:hypothetical protein [Methylobacterium bullatum]GJD41307.1 hypothetical protein OICFNHDK_3790 [Methylobacterium bullatum]